MSTKIKAYCVTHINNNRKDTSVIVATSRYEASKYVEGEVISVGHGSDISIGERLSHSSWSLDGWLGVNTTPKVSEEWRLYLIRRNLDSGMED